MNRQRTAVTMAAIMAFSAAAPMTAEASSSYSMRKKVITAAGIMTAESDDSRLVTRAQFAEMLVKASTYRSSVSSENNVSIFSDVDRNSEYASYIRVAVEQGWMTGYLGGKFKPDENITMQELAKASYLELDEEIGKTGAEVLSRFDCVNLFYNLMKTNTKENEGKAETSSTVYAAVLDFTLTSDGEINPLEALESKLKGPIAVKDRSLKSILPFSLSKASFYLDGESASADELEDGAVVIYYNTTSRAVYGYSESGNGGRGATKGTLDAIYYKSSDVMIPTSIVVDGVEYELATSDMQFAFSVYGDLKVGDEIIVIWENKTASAVDDDNDNPEYKLIDYIE